MGWFWDSKASTGGVDDPTRGLDPTLRDFLEKESPLKHEDTKPRSRPRQPQPQHPGQVPMPSKDAAPSTYRSQLGLDTPGIDPKHQDSIRSADPAAVPAESLYQDGRYAHLWKTYRSKTELEAAARSDQDRLADVVETYNDRRAAIGRAAIENCVEYQLAEKECFSNGSWAKRMTMCRAEYRAFNRCYNMQSRFLKALGYLAQQRTEEEDERIQMHADKLYHEMLERERQAKEAKEQGLEVPELPPLIQPDNTTKALGEDSAWARARQRAKELGISTNLSSFTPEKQEEIKKRIEGLSKEERDLELQLIAAESRAQSEYAEKIRERMEEERQHRAARRDRGKETFGDTIKRVWGWDQ